MDFTLEPLANYHCACGENPFWDDDRKLVYWTDIPNGRLFRYDPATGEHEQFFSGEQVGGFTLQADGSLLLFQEDKIAVLDQDGMLTVLADTIDPDMNRFNDVIADPVGRVFAGTMGDTTEKGGLYRVELDGRVTCLFKETRTSNGMAFSADQKQFYWTCSTRKIIFRFDYDVETGELSDREEVVALAEGEGTTDGMTLDTEGNIWSAIWDGHALRKFSPAGEPLGAVEFPVAKVSSAIFGGDNLDTFYVTTAGGAEDQDTADGTLYRLKVDGVKGMPEFKSRILL